MRYQHSREESAEILRRALQLMSPHKAGYHPVSYAVWYEHAAELNPGLTRELEKLLSADALLSDTDICRLHALHIAGRDVQAFELAQSQLRGVLGESEKQAAHAERTVKRFTTSLGDAVQDVQQQGQSEHGGSRLAEIVSRVLAEAAQLQTILGGLHQQLARQRQEVDQVMQRLERAQTEPLRDPLTGLKNLHGLRRAIEAQENSAGLAGVAFLAVDVDYFKRINDTHGHVIGDKVLAKVAEILLECRSGGEMAARLGGDEFALLLPGTPLAAAAALAEEIRATATRTIITRPDGMQYVGAVTLSIGVAVGEPADTLESLRHRADEALYDAKDSGRNRVALASQLVGRAAPP